MNQIKFSTPENHTQSSASLSARNPVDEAILADLITSIGAEAIEAQIEIFDLFFDSTPVLVANLILGARSGTWDRLEADLHALKGSCELFGATHLTEQCKSLRKQLANGEVAHAMEQVMEIEQEYLRVVEKLKAKSPVVIAGLQANSPHAPKRNN